MVCDEREREREEKKRKSGEKNKKILKAFGFLLQQIGTSTCLLQHVANFFLAMALPMCTIFCSLRRQK